MSLDTLDELMSAAAAFEFATSTPPPSELETFNHSHRLRAPEVLALTEAMHALHAALNAHVAREKAWVRTGKSTGATRPVVPPPLDLQAHKLFAGVKPHVMQRIEAEGRRERYVSGALLLREGSRESRLFVLLKGAVRIYFAHPDGRQVVVKLLEAPVLFGDLECLSESPILCSVEALQPCDTFELTKDTVRSLLAASPELACNLVFDMAQRFSISAQQQRAIAFHSVESRLANLLHTYASRFGLPAEGGTVIRFPLSQDSLAQSLGVARRSITRTLKAWFEEGLVTKRNGHYVVRDLDTLQRYADSSPLWYQSERPR